MAASRILLFLAFLSFALIGAAYAIYAGLFTSRYQDVAIASRQEIISAVYATGVVEPVNWIKLAPEKTGRLIEIIHNEGEAVTKGTVIARMESRVVEERLQEAMAHLIFATRDAERKRELVKKDAVSRRDAEDAEREFSEARERVHTLQREIEDLKLVSPIDGTVLRREVEVGETIQSGQTAFWVGSPKPLRITAEIDEEDIGQVKLGQTALIKADAFPNQIFEGKVSEITPQGDPVNKVFRVRIGLPDDVPLMINMTTEVNIVVQQIEDALVIPSSSEEGGYVWRILAEKTIKTPVKIGLRNDAQTQITDGLNENDVILRHAPGDGESQP